MVCTLINHSSRPISARQIAHSYIVFSYFWLSTLKQQMVKKKKEQWKEITLDSKHMFCPHLLEFRQLFCSSATNHVMFEVKLFSVVPQKAIPQHPCAIWIRLLLIPKVFLRNKTTAHNINIFQFPFVWAYEGSTMWAVNETRVRDKITLSVTPSYYTVKW